MSAHIDRWQQQDPDEWEHLAEDDDGIAAIWTLGDGAVLWMTYDQGYIEGTGEREVWHASVLMWEARGFDRAVVQRQAALLVEALAGEP